MIIDVRKDDAQALSEIYNYYIDHTIISLEKELIPIHCHQSDWFYGGGSKPRFAFYAAIWAYPIHSVDSNY